MMNYYTDMTGGESRAEFIKRYSNRVGFYHFKNAIMKGYADLKQKQDIEKSFSVDNVVWT